MSSVRSTDDRNIYLLRSNWSSLTLCYKCVDGCEEIHHAGRSRWLARRARLRGFQCRRITTYVYMLNNIQWCFIRRWWKQKIFLSTRSTGARNCPGVTASHALAQFCSYLLIKLKLLRHGKIQAGHHLLGAQASPWRTPSFVSEAWMEERVEIVCFKHDHAKKWDCLAATSL